MLRLFGIALVIVPFVLSVVAGGAPRTNSQVAAQVRVVRLGADRADDDAEETFGKEKKGLFRQINRERRDAGLNPLTYSRRAARTGDLFCLEAAKNGFAGHWDLAGRAPYLRWALAGGVDTHAENSASESWAPGPIRSSPEELLLRAHARMMAEVPPHDGHRKTVLNPAWTHVGIGMALVGGEFRMTEEYFGQRLEWVEIPAEPLPAGSVAPFAARLPRGWQAGIVEVAYERPPKPMTPVEIAALKRYQLPMDVRRFFSIPRGGMVWEGGEKGSFAVSYDGEFRLGIPLDRGKGDYYVLVFASDRPFTGQAIAPCTAAHIRAN